MSLNLEGLNPPQLEAVLTIDGPVLILAGAGTGKTRVVTFRMAYMMARGIRPESVVALTFTNKAAREMKERFGSLLRQLPGVDPDHAKKALFAGTFHSFCVRILRREIEHLGYKPNFTIYDEGDQTALIKKLVVRFGGKIEKLDPNLAKSMISLAKNKARPIESLSNDDLLHVVAHRYDEDLKLQNALDFDDLLVLALKLLKEKPEVRARLRQSIRYLMVDEYQDTNALQFEFVRLLVSDHNDLCVVGDDDQSIYSWRGADSGNILDFEHHFPNPKIIRLEQNYRSTPTILDTANSVIKNNARRRAKKLWSAAPGGEKIRLATADNGDAEASWTVSDLLQRQQALGAKWEDFAILYRTNFLSRAFEQELRRCRIPYRIVGGTSFFERREIKDILSYLQTVLNPQDDISLLRIINSPVRGIGDTCIGIMQDNALERKYSIWEEVQQPSTPLSKKQTDAVASFANLVHRYGSRFREGRPWSTTLQNLIEEIGYFNDLQKTCADLQEAQNRSDNVREFVSALATFESRSDAKLEEFIDGALLDRDKEKEEKDDGHGVTLMTLHGAKGLEFPHVYLVGLEEGFLPHDRSKLEGNLDEERRLLYVGITRAMTTLTLSHAVARKRYGKDEPRHISSFIAELPEEHLLRIEAKATLADKQVTSDTFAALRAKLAAR